MFFLLDSIVVQVLQFNCYLTHLVCIIRQLISPKINCDIPYIKVNGWCLRMG